MLNKNQALKLFLQEEYAFRRNLLSGKTEFCERKSAAGESHANGIAAGVTIEGEAATAADTLIFHTLTREDLNSIALAAEEAVPGVKAVRQRLETLIFSRLKTDEREWCATCPEGFKKPEWETIRVETDGQNPQHPAVLNAFAAHILRGEPLVADGREGIRGLMLSNAMHLSSWLGRPVDLPFDEKQFKDLLMERSRHSRRKEEADITFSTEDITFSTDGTY